MPNTYFQFKDFIIHQDKAAMKVCTDACLFGAWVAKKMAGNLLSDKYVLDIGTGTGLLSLMIAQQVHNTIEAVELDEDACEQARENFQNSPWAKRITLFAENITSFQPANSYGLIISNPPFFANDLKASGHSKNLAKHELSIHLDILFALSVNWLTADGFFALLLPAHRKEKAIICSVNYGLHLIEETTVKQTNLHAPFRVMLIFRKMPGTVIRDEIAIKQAGCYTQAFTELLKPYYLQL